MEEGEEEGGRGERRGGGPAGVGRGGVGEIEEGAKRMAEAHEIEMMQLTQETERLRALQQLRVMEDELGQRRQKAARDAWLVQQRRALMEAMLLRAGIPAGCNYDPVEGFKLRFDVVQPLPRDTQQTSLVYCLYDGTSALMPVQSVLPMQGAQQQLSEVVMDVAVDGGRRAWISHTKVFKKLPPTKDIVCIVEVQEVHPDDGLSECVGWTVLPLFNADHSLLEGSWRLPLLQAPVKTHLTTPAAAARHQRFDVVQSVPRVMVEAFDIHRMHDEDATAEAALYVRLRPCDPMPSPDDVDYEQKMADIAARRRADTEEPEVRLMRAWEDGWGC